MTAAASSARICFNREVWPEEASALESLDIPGTVFVGVDLGKPARGLGEIVNARRRGDLVAALLVYTDPLQPLLLQIFNVLAAESNRDARAYQLNALRENRLNVNGKSLDQAAAATGEAINAASLAVWLADLILVATPADHARLERLTQMTVGRWALLPDLATTAKAADGAGVTIYAPSVERGSLSGIEFALADRASRVQVISSANSTDRVAGSIVVIPELWRGYRVRALAAAGYRVAAPTQCGADALYGGIATYRATDLYSIGDAVDALATVIATPNKCTPGRETIAALLDAQKEPCVDGPVVSIVVRTNERPELLRRAIASIAAQTYANVEIVLVDNGRTPSLDAARSASARRPIVHVRPPSPASLGEALNLGMKAGTGEFIGYLDDDDIFYPDHCARAVAVLEKTGADLCYTNCVGEYAQIRLDGSKQVVGMSIYTHRPYRLDELFLSNYMTIHSVVHRRSLLDRFGYIDESLPVTEDWELWLRMAAGGARFVHLDRPTCEYSWRDDPRSPNTSTQRRELFARAYQAVIERYGEMVADRTTTILAEQQNILATLNARAEAIAQDPNAAIRMTMQDLLARAAPVEGLIE
jgi:hypothetical protein